MLLLLPVLVLASACGGYAVPLPPPLSVGSTEDVLGLSQVQVPPFVDVGVPTGSVEAGYRPPCSPEKMNPWTAGTSDTNFFYLVSETPELRTYNLTCATPGCTSWHWHTVRLPRPRLRYDLPHRVQ